MRLTSKNRTLYTATTLAEIDRNLNTSHVISAVVTLEDIIADNKVPDNVCRFFNLAAKKIVIILSMWNRICRTSPVKAITSMLTFCVAAQEVHLQKYYCTNRKGILSGNFTQTNFTLDRDIDRYDNSEFLLLCSGG